MKYLIHKNQIVRGEWQIPAVFEKDGQTFFGYDQLTKDTHFDDGWRDEIELKYNPILQTLGEPYHSELLDSVTRDVIDRTDLPTIEKAKTRKIREVKSEQRNLLLETDGYIIRRAETGRAVPQEVLDARQAIRLRADVQENEIMALPSLEEVLTFTVNF